MPFVWVKCVYVCLLSLTHACMHAHTGTWGGGHFRIMLARWNPISNTVLCATLTICTLSLKMGILPSFLAVSKNTRDDI